LFTVLPDVESDSDEDNGTLRNCSAVLAKRSIMVRRVL